jgi:hypothetical protein
MGTRFYSSSLQQFLSPDPAGNAGGLNLFSFAGARPLTTSDPTGMSGKPLTGAPGQDREGALWAAAEASGYRPKSIQNLLDFYSDPSMLGTKRSAFGSTLVRYTAATELWKQGHWAQALGNGVIGVIDAFGTPMFGETKKQTVYNIGTAIAVGGALKGLSNYVLTGNIAGRGFGGAGGSQAVGVLAAGDETFATISGHGFQYLDIQGPPMASPVDLVLVAADGGALADALGGQIELGNLPMGFAQMIRAGEPLPVGLEVIEGGASFLGRSLNPLNIQYSPQVIVLEPTGATPLEVIIGRVPKGIDLCIWAACRQWISGGQVLPSTGMTTLRR